MQDRDYMKEPEIPLRDFSKVEGEKLADAIVRYLEKRGVKNYLLAFMDPDSDADLFRYGGSLSFRTGASNQMYKAFIQDLLDMSAAQEKDDETV